MNLVSLAVLMVDKMKQYPVNNADWEHYVRDHLTKLFNTATQKQLTAREMQTYKFRPLDLLTSLGLDATVLWIFFMLNDIGSAAEFSGISIVYIPSESVLTELYSTFTNHAGELTAADAKLYE